MALFFYTSTVYILNHNFLFIFRNHNHLLYNELAYYAKLNIVPFTATALYKEYQHLTEADRDAENTTNQQAKHTIKTLTELMANNEKIIAKDIGVTKDEMKKLKHQYAYADELIKSYEYIKQTSFIE